MHLGAPGLAAGVDVVVAVGAGAHTVATTLAGGFGADSVTVSDVTEVSAAVAPYHSPLLVAAVTRRNLQAITRTSLPVVAIGPRYDPSPGGDGLLVGLDGSRRAEAVLPLAAAVARSLGLVCEFLHVTKPTRDAGPVRGPPDLLEASYLGRIAARMAVDGSVGHWDVLHAHDAAAALVEHACRRHRYLIALNTHGESAEVTAPLGRTAARVLWDSRAPVVLSRGRDVPAPPVRPPTERGAPRQRRPASPGTVHRPRAITSAARSYQTVADLRPCHLPQRRAQTRRTTLVAGLVASTVLTLVACAVPLPYYAIDGSTRPTGEFLAVDGTQHEAGEILVTLVETRTLTAVDLLRAWWDPTAEVHAVDRSSAPSGWDTQIGRQLMAQARHDATTVALTHLGLDPAVHDVEIDAHGLTGPSAGLAFALGLVDLLEPGDLTAGNRVAVTGGLDANGAVVAVGGVAHKAAAARSAGADVFIVPLDNHREAVDAAPDLHVVGVSSFDEAVAALRLLGTPDHSLP